MLRNDTDGLFECVAGEMPLSEALQSKLFEVYVERNRPSLDRGFSEISRAADWFCPSCGVAEARTKDGRWQCPQCHESLDEFHYQLVEFHPHRNRDAPTGPD
jgi:rubrerythrin